MSSRLPSLAMMSGGDDDVEPYLYSRNTIGHGNHNSNSQRPKATMVVAESGGGIADDVVRDLGKDAKVRKILWCLMML